MLGPTNFIGITITATARMTAWMKNEDFYGGRTGPLQCEVQAYAFLFIWLIDAVKFPEDFVIVLMALFVTT